MGGHGGLNILPQKSWNVYNRDNRLKVQRDEEEAARKEADEARREALERGDARLEEMRARAADDMDAAEGSAKSPRRGRGTRAVRRRRGGR